MNTIPSYYYHKDILKLVDFQIGEGFKSYDALDEIDKDDITAKCIQVLGKDACEYIIESENFDTVIHQFRKYLLSGNSLDAYDMAETMRINAVKYFTPSMEILFAERLALHESEVKRDQGLVPYQYPDNGETEWRRSA